MTRGISVNTKGFEMQEKYAAIVWLLQRNVRYKCARILLVQNIPQIIT